MGQGDGMTGRVTVRLSERDGMVVAPAVTSVSCASGTLLVPGSCALAQNNPQGSREMWYLLYLFSHTCKNLLYSLSLCIIMYAHKTVY